MYPLACMIPHLSCTLAVPVLAKAAKATKL